MDSTTKQPASSSTAETGAAQSTNSSSYKTRSSTKRTAASILDTTRSSIGSMHSTHSQYLNAAVNREIREGRDYQVPVENLAEWEKKYEVGVIGAVGEGGELEVTEVREPESEEEDRDVCLWRPEWERLDDEGLMAYCCRANQLYGIGPDRSMLILYRSNYDLELAERKLRTRRPLTPLAFFTDDDQYVFRNAITKYGKCFAKIRQMMPHKSVGALVQYYYETKKRQHYKSHVESSALTGGKFQWSDWKDESETDDEENEPSNPPKPLAMMKRDSLVCENCHQNVRRVYNVNELEVCVTCKLYFKATNQHRQCTGDDEWGSPRRPRILCPHDMRPIAEQFVEFAQPVEFTAAFEDADDSGDLQIEMPTITKCQLEISKAKQEMERVECKARQIESAAKEELRLLNSSLEMQQLLMEARDLLKRTSPGSSHAHTLSGSNAGGGNGVLGVNTEGNGQPAQQKSARLNYSWSNYEQEACFFALVRFGLSDFTLAASICNKTVDMVKRFYQENRDTVNDAIATRERFVRDQAAAMKWCEEKEKLRRQQMGGESAPDSTPAT